MQLIQQAIDNSGSEDLLAKVLVEEGNSDSFTVDFEQHNQRFMLLEGQLTLLNTGFLTQKRASYTDDIGGGALTINTTDFTRTNADSTTTQIPVLDLECFDSNGLVGSSIRLVDDLVELTQNVNIKGILQIGNTLDIEKQLDDLKHAVYVLEIGSAASTAADAAQFAQLAALAAASFLRPPSYSALPDTPEPEIDSFGSSVAPLTLVSAGQYEGIDELGATTQTVVPRGKCGLNNGFPTRCFDVVGDVRVVAGDESDVIELQPLCRLANKVAVYA